MLEPLCRFGPPLQQPSPRGPGDDCPLAGAPRGQRPLGLVDMRRRSALGWLAAGPRRFRFEAAVRFHSPSGLVYPPADVLDVRQPGDSPPEVTVGLMGLFGPSGVLPRYYSE